MPITWEEIPAQWRDSWCYLGWWLKQRRCGDRVQQDPFLGSWWLPNREPPSYRRYSSQSNWLKDLFTCAPLTEKVSRWKRYWLLRYPPVPLPRVRRSDHEWRRGRRSLTAEWPSGQHSWASWRWRASSGCRKNDHRDRQFSLNLYFLLGAPKVGVPTLPVFAHRLCQLTSGLVLCESYSLPPFLDSQQRLLNEANPIQVWSIAQMNRWSCSTILFKDIWPARSSVVSVICSTSAFRSSTAGAYAAFAR